MVTLGGDPRERDRRLLVGVPETIAHWDSIVLRNMPASFIDQSEEEKENIKMLERFAGKPFDQMEKGAEAMLRNYNQREVLKYVVEALMKESPSDHNNIVRFQLSTIPINSLATFRLSSLIMLSSELPKLRRLILPYQTILWSITANF